MKAVAYSIRPFEKEYLAIANQKKHDITLISNPLNSDTTNYAEGKDAIIVFTNDEVNTAVIEKLAGLGIKYIITRSTGTDHIDKEAADKYNIKVSNVPSYSPQAIAEHSVALAFALNRRLIKADKNSHHFDFRNEELIGFNFAGKTVGIIGLGNTGLAAAKIYNGLGCKIVGYDPYFQAEAYDVQTVSLESLLSVSDIISLHLPLTAANKHFICEETLNRMKDGVMLINTSRGGLINTLDVLTALKTGKIGYLGLDVYEHEKGLFFEDHTNDQFKDTLLQMLMAYDNVLITPHQAYLTKEALQEIADQTIKNLDNLEMKQCLGAACVCKKGCRDIIPKV
ncbi:D-lactate dehydrogenase [Mucilaginibacter sp. UYP25]|uniref:2-hydroxyacid dehydrogenase n=1 Tax=unclassified Mucilaginibacter TaxID=2617802 RepID=UPI003390BEFD